MLKKITLALLLLPLTTFAHKLTKFKDIYYVLEKGYPITLHLDLSQCSPSFPLQANIIPDSIMMLPNTISFSHNHTTLNNPNYPNTAVVENVTYHIDSDNTLTIFPKVLDPSTYEALPIQPPTIDCDLGKGAWVYD